tara:strand:- start:56 stop:274 length:219 start_codon:yes stop_codon:yes gene_type:complete
MAQNKLKKKVEALTRVVQALIKEVQVNASLSQGTITAFQLYVGEKKWNELIEEMKKIEEEKKDKKLEIPEEK